MNNYICQLNENVERIHVRYNNRYGIALAGDLYAAKDMDKSKKYPPAVKKIVHEYFSCFVFLFYSLLRSLMLCLKRLMLHSILPHNKLQIIQICY